MLPVGHGLGDDERVDGWFEGRLDDRLDCWLDWWLACRAEDGPDGSLDGLMLRVCLAE